jgi:hypothetical protein
MNGGGRECYRVERGGFGNLASGSNSRPPDDGQGPVHGAAAGRRGWLCSGSLCLKPGPDRRQDDGLGAAGRAGVRAGSGVWLGAQIAGCGFQGVADVD